MPVARVLVRRNFWPFFAGNLLSNSGTWFQNIAQVLIVYRLTRSPFLVGVVNFSQFAAVIFLAPVAGNAADRWDRRRLVIVTQASAAALAALLALITAADAATAPFHGSRPIGSLVDGAVASLAGLGAAGLLMASPALAGSLGLALKLANRKVRTAGET